MVIRVKTCFLRTKLESFLMLRLQNRLHFPLISSEDASNALTFIEIGGEKLSKSLVSPEFLPGSFYY